MYSFYLSTYIGSIITYFILINFINLKFIKANMCCILNDFIFYFNLTIYFINVLNIFKDSKPFFICMGVIFIILRFLLIKNYSGFFSNFFGFSAVEYESNNVFFKLMNDSDNYLTKVYSKYGPLINNIDYPARGSIPLPKEVPKYLDMLVETFFDFTSDNKKKDVRTYFKNALNIDEPDDEDINKVVYLLDKKFLISKFLWNIILITILFCLSLKYI